MTNQTGETTRKAAWRRPIVLVVLVLLLIIIVVAVYYFVIREEDEGMSKPDTVEDQQEAADDALEILRDLAEDNYTTLGFESEEEADASTLGMPLTLYLVPLDGLQAYEGEVDPRELLQDSRIVMYPVLVNDTVRSAVGIQGSEEGWTPATFGSATLIQAIARVELNTDSFIVQVPVLGIYFVGEQTDDGLVLTPIVETGYDLPVGQQVAAGEVFSVLQEAARDVDPDAPM